MDLLIDDIYETTTYVLVIDFIVNQQRILIKKNKP